MTRTPVGQGTQRMFADIDDFQLVSILQMSLADCFQVGDGLDGVGSLARHIQTHDDNGGDRWGGGVRFGPFTLHVVVPSCR